MRADERPAFILIDHSIAGKGGHNLEYARHVLDAAVGRGYRPVLATNRAFHESDDLPYEVHCQYERDMWGRRFERANRRVPATPTAPFSLSPSRPGLQGLIAAFGTLPNSAPQYLRAARLLARHPRFVGEAFAHERTARAFARGTRELLRGIRPGPRDLVFIPTLSEADLMGLVRCFGTEQSSELPVWHLLFRRDIFCGRESSYADDADPVRRIRRYLIGQGLREIAHAWPRHRVHSHTDTERLTDQYSRIGAGAFSTIPIPVNPLFRPASRTRTRPLLVTYVGDARAEKGYELLPGLVDALMPELETGVLRFAFQSNITTDPAKEPGVVRARERLRGYPRHLVRLYEQPLSSSAYAEALLASDIVLVPYSPDQYYARSSAILVEALSAGIPVLVPAVTWMSDVLQGETARYHDALLAQLDSGSVQHQFAGARSSIRLGPTHAAVLVRITSHAAAPAGTYLRVTARFTAGDEAALPTDERVLNAAGGVAATALFRVPSRANAIELAIDDAFGRDPIGLPRVQVSLLNSPGDVAVEALGRTYASLSRMADALREMLAGYETYRANAVAFSTRWRSRHSPALLVERLETAQREQMVPNSSTAPTGASP